MLLITAMVFSVTACGGKKEQAPEETVIGNQETVEEAVEETTEAEVVEEETQVQEEAAVVGDTLGQTLLAAFEQEVGANEQAGAQELADALITNEAIKFAGATMPVEAGFLMGFASEISGFEEGVMFAPMIGTIPFVGYVFTMADGADTDAFMQTLTDNADPRWNICTEAEETVVEKIGNKVFFLMCPTALEE